MSHAFRAWSFLILFSLTLIVFGQVFFGREGLLIALVLTLAINAYVYFFEDERIIHLFKGRLIEGQDPWGVGGQLEAICKQMRVGRPRLFLIPGNAPQGLVVGRSISRSTVLLTEGFFRKLNPEERKAVLVYLLSNVKNYNTLAFCVGSFMVSALLWITGVLDLCFRILIVEKKNPRQAISQPFTRIIAPLAGAVLKLSLRPSFYFSADQMAASHLTKTQATERALAEALWKINAYAFSEPLNCPICTSHMFVVNPLTTQNWNRYFHAQPTADNRIRALIGHYPI